MSAVLNDRDAILQGAATRIVNPKNADILLQQSAPAFHVNAAGAADVASITVSATLVGLEGAVSWSVQGATLSNVTDREATVTYAAMQGSTAIVSASIMSSGERFAKSVVLATIQDGAPGSSAKTVKLTPSEQVFKVSKTGTNSPASITLTATGQNTTGAPSFTIPVGTATLSAGSSAAQKVLTFANMTTDQVTIEVTLDGQKDRVTIYKVREGQDGQPGADGVVGLLSNESVNLPASDTGVVSSVSGAACTMKVYRGAADDSANWAYVYSPASAAGGLQYTTSGGTLTITGLATGVDSAFVDITASRAGYASITKRFSVAKAKSGAGGTPGVDARNLTLVASSQVVQVAKNGTASPASVTLTSTAQSLAGTPTFAITSGTATLTGTGSARSFTYASMTSDSVTVRVTQDGLTDTVTIVKLREGADGAAAITGMLSNEIVTLPASSAGVVSSFSGAVCSMKVYNGTADDTANWGFAYTPFSSTASLQYTTTTSGTVTVTGMNNGVDSAYVDITASRTGYASITKRFTVTKSKAGASVTGARGAGTYYVVGSAWSDVAAQAACPGGPVVNDQVTISNGTVTYTKRWDGAAWNVPGAYLSDDLFVEKGIRASKIDTDGLVVRANGVPILGINVPLDAAYAAPGTKNSAISIGSDGTLGGAGGGKVTITGLGYTGALDATKGAPAGTTVGGTDAGLVASRAMNGDSAYNAVNNATTGLAAKLSAAGNQNLTGPIALTANGAIVVGNTNTGVVTNTGGITLRKNGVTTVAMNVDGTAYYGGELGAGIVTAKALAVSANPDNILPDPRFKDLAWWGVAGTNVEAADWSDRNTVWRDSASLYLGPEPEVSRQSEWFTIQKGARYRFEIQTGASANFAGQVSIFLLIDGVVFHSIGQPNKYNWPAYNLPCQYDSNSPKQVQSFSAEYVVPDNANGRCRVVIIKKVDAGTFEFGSLRITRMSDSTLIGPGSVETKHLAIAEGGDINSGMPAWGAGKGFRLEGDLPGQHPARMAIGEANGAGLIWDGFELKINRPKLASPFSVQLTDVRITQQINGSTIQFSAPKTITSGSGSYSYTWSFTSSSGSRMEMISSPAAEDAAIKASGSNVWLYGYLALTLKDLNSGLTSTAYCDLTVQFGSAVEP